MSSRRNEVANDLLDDIERVLLQQGKTVADLAREIDRSYHQTYAWLKLRRFAPSLPAFLILKEWRDKQGRQIRRAEKAVTQEK